MGSSRTEQSSAKERIALFTRLICLAAATEPNRHSFVREGQSEHGDSAQMLEWLASRKIDSAAYLYGNGLREAVPQMVYDAAWRAQREALVELIQELDRQGISPIVVKGADAAERYFGSSGFGLFNDIDLLVGNEELQDVSAVLLNQGYRQAVFDRSSFKLKDRSVRDIAAIQATHYELPPFCKLVPLTLEPRAAAFASGLARHPIWVCADGTPWIVVEFDVHFQLATDVDSEQFFERARPGPLGGRSLSATDTVWFVAARHYMEVGLLGKTGLRDLFYVAAAVKRETVDWDLLLHKALELQNAPALFYPLSLIAQAIPDCVPESVLKALSPLTASRDRDFGWQMGKLFDFVEPFPCHGFGHKPPDHLEYTEEMRPVRVPQCMSRSSRKRILYSVDAYFIEGWEEALYHLGQEAETHLRDKALIVFKPEAVVGRRIRSALSFLHQRGFRPMYWHRFRYSRDTIRVAWQYQLNIATRQRLRLVDLLETSTDSLCVLFKLEDVGATSGSACEVLSELKGPADPSKRSSHHLRTALGLNALLINYVHSADEPADLVREVAVYVSTTARQELWQALRDGTAAPEGLEAHVDALENETLAHDLDFQRSLDRLCEACGKASPQMQGVLQAALFDVGNTTPGSWEKLQELLDAASVSYELWDLIVVGAHTTQSNRSEMKVILG